MSHMYRTNADSMAPMQADYEAARINRFRRRRQGIQAMGSGADYHYQNFGDFMRVLEEARDMERNDLIVGQMVTKAVNNTVKDGFVRNPDTGDPELDKDLAARFDEWASDADLCDVQGEATFDAMEKLVFRRVLVDGDIVALPLRDGPLQLKEAHELASPTDSIARSIVHGVQLDKTRKRIAYWFRPPDGGSFRLADQKLRAIPARDDDGQRQVYHIYNPERVTQTRGVTAFRAMFDALTMFEDLNWAKLLQAKAVSAMGFIFERTAGVVGGGTQIGEQTTESTIDSFSRVLENLHPAMIVRPPAGIKVNAFSPNVPNAEFFDHVKLILTLVGNNIGLPLVLLLLDASETNFSGWRGAIDQARIGFEANQCMLINRFHTPVWRWKVRQWISEDESLARQAAKKKIKIYKHRWDTPCWPYIEPTKDAQGDILRKEGNLISMNRLMAERGRDWDEIHEEIVDDNVKLITRAIDKATEINTKYQASGFKVDWRELCNMTVKDKPATAIENETEDENAPSNAAKGVGDGS